MINKLFEILKTQDVTDSDLDDLLEYQNGFPSEAIEKLSIEVAIEYWKNNIDFETGDKIMINLYNYWMSKLPFDEGLDFGEIPFSIYIAFDEGEDFRDGDDHKINPGEKYTKPKIEKILTQLNLLP